MRRYYFLVILVALLATSCSFKAKKYDDPITKDTKQPDKVLFDHAVNDIEHGRFEIARITLNTMINTYDQSEFLAKAKLAIADSWFREGGAAAESQNRICQIHYKQMDKSDRDSTQAIRAEDECRQLITQFPNSKYVDETKQLLRNIQESLAEGEYLVGNFYFKHGDNSAAANRLAHVVDQYPLYSKADLALWEEGQAFGNLGNRFRKQEGEAYAKIVRDYPLSDYADDAAKKLKELEMPVPEADKNAVARMQYEKDHKQKLGMVASKTVWIRRNPDTSMAAKSGDPAMSNLRPSVPPLVPQPAGTTGFTGDVTATTVGNSSALDSKPDARANPPAQGAAPAAQGQNTSATTPAADSTQQASSQQASQPAQQTAADQANAKKKKKNKKQQQQNPAQPADSAQPASSQPATAQPAAAPTTPPASTAPSN
jgi:outer membrane protein assembly factor BamD